jgi:hypothetical protein
MSSLWTPGGEHPVGPTPRSADPQADPAEPSEERTLSADDESALAEAAEEIAKVREQLAATPAELVVANHLMGLYELAAIHLNRDEPNLEEARLAIDAMGAALDKCRGRLGEPEATLVDARAQLQMAFVNVANWVREQRD